MHATCIKPIPAQKAPQTDKNRTVSKDIRQIQPKSIFKKIPNKYLIYRKKLFESKIDR